MSSAETHKPTPTPIPTDALRAKVAEAYTQQTRAADEERWILDNLPLVRHIANKITANLSGRIDIEDLISAGTVGLVRAARAYDTTRDAEFRTYAYIRVRGAIIDELRGRSFVPGAVHKRIQQVGQAYQTLLGELGRPPGDVELAQQAGMSQEELYQTFQEARKQHFLSIHGLSDDGPVLPALVPKDKSPSPQAQVERKEMLVRMTEAITKLPKKERIVLLLYYRRDLTMKEIAQVLDLTESRVSQIHAGALFKLSVRLG